MLNNKFKLNQIVRYNGGDIHIEKREKREDYWVKHNQIFKIVLITFNTKNEVIYKATSDIEENFIEDKTEDVWIPYKTKGNVTWFYEYELKKYSTNI